MPEFTVSLSDEQIEAIRQLAEQRGVAANTIVQQAISTEKLIADNVGTKDELLIKRGDTYHKVIFDKS